jgi:hypothetical protein
VLCNKGFVHAEVRLERRGHCGNNTLPFHFHSLFHVVSEIKLATRAGSTGGLTDSAFQPQITFIAAPQILP